MGRDQSDIGLVGCYFKTLEKTSYLGANIDPVPILLTRFPLLLEGVTKLTSHVEAAGRYAKLPFSSQISPCTKPIS
jgi:hypothetical protein